jgi:hypothetical protein
MYLVSHISELIRGMCSRDNVTTDISARLHFAKVKEAYRSSNKVNYIGQMLRYHDRFTSLDYLKETLSYLSLEGRYDVNCAKVFNLLSTTYKRRNTRRAHLLHLETIQDQPFMRPVSQ